MNKEKPNQSSNSKHQNETKASDTITLASISDFPVLKIAGFAPAYKDEDRGCLAIDAALYKGEFAAAKTSFPGKTGEYDIKLVTLLEFDGESKYVVKINNNTIGGYKNARTNKKGDMSLSDTTFKSVKVEKGDSIQVEFNSHTNELIPEDGGTAYSRGRWKYLRFIPSSKE
ncbi:MAG: hypothetical protein GVY19_03035 [Bacteroidetes bacterium]|nr:hypothetical protein [Bacteroidota bacterium]